MKLPAYPRYKPSGVEWLGDVPEHWDFLRLREGVKLVNGYPFEAEQFARGEGIPLVRIRDIFGTSTEVTWAGEWIKAAAISNDDILVGMDGDFNVAWWRSGDAQLNQRVCCLRAKQDRLDQRFLFYFVPFPLKQLNDITYSTTVKHLSSFDVLKFRLFAPPVSEQRAIAAFLDRETGRVDRLVAKKRELIERLKEKRTGLISRTVTRGLPPPVARAAGLPENPPLKSSGLDWLGDIPAHWRVMALKWRSRCHSGDSIATEDATPEPTPERNVPVIGGNGVMGYCDSSNCEHPVLVIGRVGALCGNVHLIAPPAWITDNALVMPTDAATFSQKYLAAVLRTRNLNELADKTAQPLITGTRIRNERIPVPPLLEQTAIAAYLDEEAAKLDALVGKVAAAAERLQEYRTALITAAVTGKIDVRNTLKTGMKGASDEN